MQFFAQSVDENGNVGVTTNKALFYAGEPAPACDRAPSRPLLNGVEPPANPFFTGDVTVAGTSTEPGVTVEVNVTGPESSGGFVDTFTATADGAYTVVAEGSDGSTATTSFVIDTNGPVILVRGPADGTSGPSTSIVFDVSEPATLTCTLDGNSFTPCVSPAEITGLTNGSHTFTVQGVDALGNAGAPASTTWTVDLQPPDTTIDDQPQNPSATSTASFVFSSTEPGSSFECSLDGGGFLPCATPQSYSGLADGSHAFAVRAVDASGNDDPTPATYGWTVDTAAPDTTITTPPISPSQSAAQSFAFTSTEPGSTFRCSLDGGGFVACTSPQAYVGLADGVHTFSVRAVDAAGNADATPAAASWTIDTVVPVVTLTGGPVEGSLVSVRTATLRLHRERDGHALPAVSMARRTSRVPRRSSSPASLTARTRSKSAERTRRATSASRRSERGRSTPQARWSRSLHRRPARVTCSTPA